jgi:DNA gyrase/topoisomerase IV subunit B
MVHDDEEVLDNCIDEFVMGAGKIEVTIRDKQR